MTADWLEALTEYMRFHHMESELEDTYERHYDPENFGCHCDQCGDYERAGLERRRLMDGWGDIWAVQLFNIREHVIGLMKSVEEAKRA